MTPRFKFALFDAAGLSADELAALRSEGDVIWGYDDIPDQKATELGPVWRSLDTRSEALLTKIWADEHRWWAASWGEAQGGNERLSAHLRRLRYVRTHDSQRYFFRFADARCLSAMARALEPVRRHLMTGPVQTWKHLSHTGEVACLAGSQHGESPSRDLRISAAELGRLLEGTWPDQLLFSTRELAGAAPRSGETRKAHAWASRLCQLFRERAIDSFPVQIEAMKWVVESNGTVLQEEFFASVLVEAQREGEAQIVRNQRSKGMT